MIRTHEIKSIKRSNFITCYLVDCLDPIKNGFRIITDSECELTLRMKIKM